MKTSKGIDYQLPVGKIIICLRRTADGFLNKEMSRGFKSLYSLPLLLLLCVFSFSDIYAQQQQQPAITGKVKDSEGSPLAGVTILLDGKRVGVTNMEGLFSLTKLKPGTYTLSFELIGYTAGSRNVSIGAGTALDLDVVLTSQNTDLNEVSVIGRTATTEINRQAYNVTAVDTRKLHNTTLDLAHALDRVSGVRIRESGGVGSGMDLSLNGFTGRQVKFFIDGLPMDNFGSSFQINNIPVNLAKRIEVYKGVVPIWLGSDALGGAINIVTDMERFKTYLDVSYSYGSFNTHRSALNFGHRMQNGATVMVNAYQNYSDNNYWVTAGVEDIANSTGVVTNMRVRRFHDRYRNETAIIQLGVTGKKYADKLLFGIIAGQNKADIQTGARMDEVFGSMYRKGNTLMPTFKYSKSDLFTKGLNVNISANFNFGSEQNVDTVARHYNWLGEYRERARPGGERNRSLYKFRNNTGVASANIDYRFAEKHAITLNNTFNTFDRKGSDELYPNNADNNQPRGTRKNITGLGYRYDHYSRWNATAFVKYYSQFNHTSESYRPVGSTEILYRDRKFSYNKFGYGAAGTYFLTEKLQLKASYEYSYRLPENDEIFGDMINLIANVEIRPEASNYINVGASYVTKLKEDHVFHFDGSFIYRKAKDFIRPVLNQREMNRNQLVNLRDVTNTGFEAEIRYSFKKRFTAGVNATYQDLRNKTLYEEGTNYVSKVYKDRVPNMPYLYGNADASVFFPDLFKKGNQLTIGYNMLYVHGYYLRWPSQGNAADKFDIPYQVAHDANLVYSMNNGKYNVALECRNIADADLFDNFRLQKPSRSFNVKLRYYFDSKHLN